MFIVLLKRISLLATVSFLAGALVLSGCASLSTQDESKLSPQQRALRADAREWEKTVATGVLAGAAVGALVGFGIDKLLGGRGGAGALAGGVVGGAAGGALGGQVANKNQDQSGRAQNADDRLTKAHNAALQLQKTAETAEQTTAENRRRLAQLDRQYHQGQLTAAQYNAEASTMREDVTVMRKATSGADKAQNELTQGSQTSNLASEERKMAAARTRLSKTTDDLEAALRRVPAA